jgi:hypothetical protein
VIESESLTAALAAKKKDVVEHFEVFDHVGVLSNGPPGRAELPFF